MDSLVFVLGLTIFGISVAASPRAHEVLTSYGFPDGLLPKTMENSGEDYNLDGSGAFELHLERSCSFTIPGSYEVKYASRIAGSIESDRLRNLSGISDGTLIPSLLMACRFTIPGSYEFEYASHIAGSIEVDLSGISVHIFYV